MTCFITYLLKSFLQREEKAKIAKKTSPTCLARMLCSSAQRRIAQLQLHFAAPSHGQGRKRSLDGAVF